MTVHLGRGRASLGVAAVLALIATAGCSERFDIGLATGTTATSTQLGGQGEVALIGRWPRAGSPNAGNGGAVYLTTVWEFRADGTATRTITTRTLQGQTLAVSEALISWRLGNGTLLLDFGAPSGSTLRVPYFIDYGVGGTTLTLDGIVLLRVDP
ncbi:MAG: hypothetical protein WKG32_11675 [Gemmatimonadaceae bacterium]